jgi:SWI/SNF related-matrix-associated actin-dependent regulator of chromatin subfamily C
MAARAPAEWEEASPEAFASIAEHLRQQPNFGAEDITAKLLAQTTSSLVAFCSAQFGAEGRAKNALTKLPWRFFSDFSVGGPLSAILLAMFQHKVAHAWRRFDFKLATKTEMLVGMLRKIEAQLKESGHLVRPVCYISSALPAADAATVAQILKAKGATVVASADAATHCIEPDPPGTTRAETGEEDFLRQVERGDMAGKPSARVHWYYYPDSYDEWIPVEDIHGDLGVEPMPTKSRWVIHRRWVDDLELYNEFMCECDYEVQLEAADGAASSSSAAARHKHQRVAPERRSRRERRPSRAAEDSAAGEDSGRNKRRRSAKATDSRDETLPDEAWDLEPPRQDTTGMDLEEPAEDGMMMLKKVENAPIVNEHGLVIRDISNSTPQAAADAERGGGGDAEHPAIVAKIPPEAAWFDKNKLHEKERIALPDFFNGKYPSKNSHTYRQYRDFMLDTYRKQPSKYLHLSTCRSGVSSTMRRT